MLDITARQPFYRADGGQAAQLAYQRQFGGFAGAVGADAACQVQHILQLVLAPVAAIPYQPASPCRHVAPVLAVTPGKGVGQVVLGNAVQYRERCLILRIFCRP
jgi:hypothetical protein